MRHGTKSFDEGGWRFRIGRKRRRGVHSGSGDRLFPGPWRVDVTEGGHFLVKDATGFSICYVYARNDEALRSAC